MSHTRNWQAPLLGLGLAVGLLFPAFAEDEDVQAEDGGRTCFWLSSINDFRAIDNKHVYVRGVGKDQRYLLTLMNYCHGVRFAETIALSSRPTNRLCSNGNEHLTVFDGGGLPQNCLISDVEKVADLDAARDLVEDREKAKDSEESSQVDGAGTSVASQ